MLLAFDLVNQEAPIKYCICFCLHGRQCIQIKDFIEKSFTAISFHISMMEVVLFYTNSIIDQYEEAFMLWVDRKIIH